MVEKDQDKHKPPAVHVQLVPFFYGQLPFTILILKIQAQKTVQTLLNVEFTLCHFACHRS